MRVQSAVDIWSEALIFSAIAFMCTGALFVTAMLEFSLRETVIGGASVLLASLFLLWLLFGTYYDMRRRYLLCKCGPFTAKIYYDDIRYVGLSTNLSTSLALSSRRIEIRQYDGDVIWTVMISPVNRELFLDKLRARCPHLDVQAQAE